MKNVDLKSLNLDYQLPDSPFSQSNLISLHQIVKSFFNKLNSKSSVLNFSGSLSTKERSFNVSGSITKSKIILDIFLKKSKRSYSLVFHSGLFFVSSKKGDSRDAKQFSVLFTNLLKSFSNGNVKFVLN